MENLEQSALDANSEVSSASPEGTSSPKEAEQSASHQEKEVSSFDKHPRFQELINTKHEFVNYKQEASKQLQDYAQRIKEMEDRFKSLQPREEVPENKLLNRLKGIDPEFGSWAEQTHKARIDAEAKLAEADKWRKDYEQTNYLTSARSVAEKARDTLKVNPVLHNMYLSNIPMGTPVAEIEARYKAIHDSVAKVMEEDRRAAIASYSKTKTQDASVPTNPKGSSPKPGTSKIEYSKDPSEARAQIVKNAMKAYRSNNG